MFFLMKRIKNFYHSLLFIYGLVSLLYKFLCGLLNMELSPPKGAPRLYFATDTKKPSYILSTTLLKLDEENT